VEAGTAKASAQLQPGTYICGVTCTYSFLGLGAAVAYGLVYHASLPEDEGLLATDGGLLARLGQRLLAPPALLTPPDLTSEQLQPGATLPQAAGGSGSPGRVSRSGLARTL
jgi:hypothetical protein